MLIVLAGRLRRGERCRRRRDVQGASFGGSFVPCELRHPRQGCLSCEYRVDVVWSPFILSIDFFYVVYCSPYYFSLYNPRTPHLYFLCLLLSIYSITYTTFSIAPFYALILLSLVFKKKKKNSPYCRAHAQCTKAVSGFRPVNVQELSARLHRLHWPLDRPSRALTLQFFDDWPFDVGWTVIDKRLENRWSCY